MADNLGREGRYVEAVAAFDAAIDAAQSAARLLPTVDPTCAALLHKAQAAALSGDTRLAILTYEELATTSDAASALLQAGLAAERNGEDDQAAHFYRSVASETPSPRTDDPAQLAWRALQRIERREPTYFPSAETLGVALATSLKLRDVSQLDRLVGTTHFAVAPAGGHMVFEHPEMLEELYRDLLASSITVRPKLLGSGQKRYLSTSGWTGEWFREDVAFALTRAPKGWQWTGVIVKRPHELWIERWRPATEQVNQPLPFPLRAPWPAGQSFTAGGLNQFIAQQAAIVAAGWLFGGALAFAYSESACGFGPRGFYYHQGSTHDEQDAFAIDFTRYERYLPYDPESGGTPVLAAADGIVVGVSAGTESGDGSASNTVQIVHHDPDNPADISRFRSRYLHLAGPFMIRVSELMPVIAGQRLGLMDDTGNSVLDHLHFSVHDREIPHRNVSYGASVRPSPLSGVSLGDADSGRCVKSNNVERVPGLNFTPPVLTFGSVAVGEVGSRTVTAKNTLGPSIEVSIEASQGGVFEWGAVQVVLPNGGETSFDVTFTPTSSAIQTGTLTVTSSAPGSPHSIGLVGKGPGGFPVPDSQPQADPPPRLLVIPGTLNFGSVPLGTNRTRKFTIENPTGRDVDVAFAGPPSGSPFEWAAFKGVLADGEDRSFDVSFRPASNAIQQAFLAVTSSAPGSPHSIGFIGKGPGGF